MRKSEFLTLKQSSTMKYGSTSMFQKETTWRAKLYIHKKGIYIMQISIFVKFLFYLRAHANGTAFCGTNNLLLNWTEYSSSLDRIHFQCKHLLLISADMQVCTPLFLLLSTLLLTYYIHFGNCNCNTQKVSDLWNKVDLIQEDWSMTQFSYNYAM